MCRLLTDCLTQRLLTGETHQGIKLYPSYGNGRYYFNVKQYCSTYYTDTLNAITKGLSEGKSSNEPFTILSGTEASLNVTFERDMADVALTIYDTQGQLIVSKHIERISVGSVVEVDLPTAVGVYILYVAEGNSVFSKQYFSE